MASPFSIFRKHQRVMMAVLGVAAMIAFVFLGPLEQLLSQRGGQDALVATTVYGKIRESDLQQMRASRNLANLFWQEAFREASSGYRTEALRFGSSTDETALVETSMLAKMAAESGVVISDRRITDWLRKDPYLGDRVTTQQYEGIVRGLKVSREQVYDALRTELLAEEARLLFAGGASQTTPAQRWEYFQRLNRTATAEVVPVKAEEFIDKIADPSDEEIEKFFEEHKEAEPVPGSPDPAFKIPHKVKIEYLVADHTAFVDTAAVTEQEIKDHYENKKQEYLFSMWARFAPKEKLLEPPPAKPEETPKAEKPEASPAPDKKTEVETPADTKSDAPKSEGAEKAAPKTESSKAEAPKSEPPKAEPPKADTPKAEPPKTDGAATTPPTRKPPQLSAPTSTANALRVASAGVTALGLALEATQATTAPESDKTAAGKDAKSPPSTDAKASAPTSTDKAAPEKSAAGKSSPDKSSPDKSAADKPVPDEAAAKKQASGPETSPAPATTPSPLAPSTPLLPTGPPKPPFPPPTFAGVSDEALLPRSIDDVPTYLPLSYVAESIREELANRHAMEKMQEAIDVIKAKMQRYSTDRSRWEVRQGTERATAPPTPLDLEALAEANKLTLHETDLLTGYQAIELPGIGKSFTDGQNPVSFYQLAFKDLAAYQPATTVDLLMNGYLFWKTENVKAHVPELAQVRGEVVRAWKMIIAREPAMKKARELADYARTDHRPLSLVFAGRTGIEVTETGPFSWLTQSLLGDPSQRPAPTISEVTGVVDAGEDFMREVFGLHVDDVGTAFNKPQTIAYVIRVKSFEPATRVLQDEFFAMPLQLYDGPAAYDRQRMIQAWTKSVEDKSELDWKREPDRGRSEP